MKITLDEILNIHKRGHVLILGSGGSLNKLNFENFTGKIIALGSTIFEIKKIRKNFLLCLS